MDAKGVWGRFTSRVAAPKPGTPAWPVWRVITAMNTQVYRLSGGRVLGRYDDAPVLILHHRGRRSGEPRETPLVYLPDGERAVIVGSMGGNPKNPAWVHNLRARPEVEVEIGRSRRTMTAREAEGDERDALWPRLYEVWPAWRAYQQRTERTFPVFVLEP